MPEGSKPRTPVSPCLDHLVQEGPQVPPMPPPYPHKSLSLPLPYPVKGASFRFRQCFQGLPLEIPAYNHPLLLRLDIVQRRFQRFMELMLKYSILSTEKACLSLWVGYNVGKGGFPVLLLDLPVKGIRVAKGGMLLLLGSKS